MRQNPVSSPERRAPEGPGAEGEDPVFCLIRISTGENRSRRQNNHRTNKSAVRNKRSVGKLPEISCSQFFGRPGAILLFPRSICNGSVVRSPEFRERKRR